MAEPFIGEIKMLAFQYAPRDWADCNGQSMPIAQHQALYSLVGAVFGGNGATEFNLPDYRGRTPIHQGSNGTSGNWYHPGNVGGVERVSLTPATTPAHSHIMRATDSIGTSLNPTNGGQNNALLAVPTSDYLYSGSSNLVALHPETVSSAGGGQSHEKIQPSLGLRFAMALKGTYPSRN